jgi:CRP-like cAMP-binding protein
MEQLFAMLTSIFPVSDALVEYLNKTLVMIELEPKDFLLRKGQVSNHIYFVERGIVRCYDEDENQKQTTLWFMDEGNVIVAVESFFGRTPSTDVIQALEYCVLFGITYDQLYYAYRKFIEFNYHGRELTTKYYLWSAQRNKMLQRMRAPERYAYTKKTQPGILERESVTKAYLSSYLGITAEHLSRIK